MKRRIALVLLAMLGTAAQATEIYKWTDENGRVHFGEEVPDRYKNKAIKKDPGPLNVMQPQEVTPPPATPATPPPAAAAPEPMAPATSNLSDEQRCRQQMQRYQESMACFAPFVNANGSVKPEAYEQCEQVPRPTCAAGLNDALP